MPQIKKVSIRFAEIDGNDSRYIDDREKKRNTVYVARVPASLYNATNEQLKSIYEAGNGIVAKIGGVVINKDAANALCTESDNITPRKLVFVLNNGNTLSVPVAERDALVPVANAVINAIPQDKGKVVCIQLEGERIGDLLAELGGSYTGVPVNDVSNSLWYTGNAQYAIDGKNQNVQLSYKIASPDGEKPPAILETAWNGCVGALTQSRGCGGQSRRYEKRRYIPQYIVGAAGGGGVGESAVINGDNSNEIPVAKAVAGDIDSCGKAIVSAVGGALFCLPYVGHGDRSFQNVEGIQLN